MDLRRLGPLSLGLGLVLSLVARSATPIVNPPLYDGVVVVEPYRYLVPPPGGRGAPLSAAATESLDHGASPLTAIATGEQPPQAQIFAIPGALTLPAGTTSIKLSIAPIAADGEPADGHIVGNIYRILVTNQDGAPIIARATDKVSVVLRGPGSLAAATIERFTAAASWQPLSSNDAGFGSTFLAVVTEFGDFALVVAGSGPTAAAAASGTAPSIGPQAPSLAASSGPPSSGVVAAAEPVGPISSTGGSEIELVGVVVIVIVGLGGLVAWRARRARRSARYRGAHRRDRRR